MEEWFGHVESRFRSKVVFEEWDRFDHTVVALSKEVIQLGFNAVAHLDNNEPFSRLGSPNSNDLRKSFTRRVHPWGQQQLFYSDNFKKMTYH
jgi:hypothetical protein